MRPSVIVSIGFVTLALAGPAPGQEQRSPEWRLCTGRPDVEWDRQITACTALIESGRESPRDQVIASTRRGGAYYGKGDLDRAIADYSEAIRLDPKDGKIFNDRGNTYNSKGDLDRAMADYNEAIRLDPKLSLPFWNRGVANLYAGSLAEAIADLSQASELDPKFAYAALWLDIANKRSNLPSRLPQQTAQFDMTKWPAPLVRLYLGQMTAQAALAAAADANADTNKDQTCEANFYSGELALQQGAKDEAIRLFRLAASGCPRHFIESGAADAELKALGATP